MDKKQAEEELHKKAKDAQAAAGKKKKTEVVGRTPVYTFSTPKSEVKSGFLRSADFAQKSKSGRI